MPKTAKKAKVTATKRKTVAKKTTRTKKASPKKITAIKKVKEVQSQSKAKFFFLLGVLIIATGGFIMVEVLGLSIKGNSVNHFQDFFFFPLVVVFLLLGIGIVVNHSFYSKD